MLEASINGEYQVSRIKNQDTRLGYIAAGVSGKGASEEAENLLGLYILRGAKKIMTKEEADRVLSDYYPDYLKTKNLPFHF